MIRHVVLFKFKPEVNQAVRADFVRRLRQLAADVETVRALEVGINFAESARAHDVALIADFDDRTGLAAYADHPRHQPVKALAAELCSALPVVDYEVELS